MPLFTRVRGGLLDDLRLEPAGPKKGNQFCTGTNWFWVRRREPRFGSLPCWDFASAAARLAWAWLPFR
jgi:hypothetical protein